VSLHKARPQQLVTALKSDNLLWRMHAQRLLVDGGNKDVVPALCELAADQTADEIGLNPGAIHALWTLQGLGVLEGSTRKATQAAMGSLKHPSAGVRRAAVTVLPRNQSGLDALLDGGFLKDSDAQVRLAALLAVSEMPASAKAGAAIFAALQDPRNSEDRWIPDAATSAAARNDAGFIKAVLSNYKPAATGPANDSPTNLLPNASFEEQRNGQPAGWRTSTHSGRGELTVGEIGRTGTRSAKIVSEQGGDISWSVRVPVKPRTDYRLSGWIKTENVRKVGGANGAMLNVHELQDPVRGGTKALVGDNDWTAVQLNFNSGEMRDVTINCLFGGWGRVTGTAWFDDLELAPAAGSELAGEVGRVVRLVTAHYAQRGPVDSIVATLASLNGASPALAVPVLDGLVSGWPEDKAPKLGSREKKTLTSLMASMPESMRDRLLALSQRWNQPELFGANIAAITDSLKKQITDVASLDDKRVAAARRLIGLDGKPEMIELVLSQITLLTSPQLGSGFVSALTASRSPETGQALIAHWPQLTPAVRRNAVAALMRRGDWTTVLLDAVEKAKIGRTDLAVEHWSQLKQNPNRMIARRAERLSVPAGTVSADREEIVKKLLPLARERGDAVRGKEVFTANCVVCHVINGQGGKIGPDLSGIGSRDRTDILLEILDPNRSVEANYRLWNVTTKGGDTYSGRLETETQTSVEILDTTGQKHVISRKDIGSMEGSQLSIMPTGMEALPTDDLKALLEYLAQAHP
jgi:putative heme-binding domain-containing protein